ncbi:MAG TPA: hypothetical protein DCZ04_01460, partial [Syntrophorhabdus aromaticivorans]|nr:hypothetical protein [Syntrophorhabdus aromaticivorans]
ISKTPFRGISSEPGLQPIYHQKHHGSDGRLFITVLAYHILQTIRFTLKSRKIYDALPLLHHPGKTIKTVL